MDDLGVLTSMESSIKVAHNFRLVHQLSLLSHHEIDTDLGDVLYSLGM